MGPVGTLRVLALSLASLATLAAATAQAQAQVSRFPITPGQRATAQQVAEAGVPLSELAPNAPDAYTVKRGDTLWAISGLFLRSPWRWPELWGMNLQEIRNPHLIYPGQELYLDKSNGRARLRFGRPPVPGASVAEPAVDPNPVGVVKLSPGIRATQLGEAPIPTLAPNLTEPFLSDALIVELAEVNAAPRIVAAQEGRVMLSRGDRAYARGLPPPGAAPRYYRIFRNATPLKDPRTGEILAYEAQLVGRAEVMRPETTREQAASGDTPVTDIIPATIDILDAKEEMRVGDRLLPEPPREFSTYAPRAPGVGVDARVVSVYGSAVKFAAQNQVVVINHGARDGLVRGDVLAILKEGERLVDRTDPAKPTIQLPDERNGLLMVFRTFERVSYALILQITDGVKVGDRLINPR